MQLLIDTVKFVLLAVVAIAFAATGVVIASIPGLKRAIVHG